METWFVGSSMSEETKRDLLYMQKRPSIYAKETYGKMVRGLIEQQHVRTREQRSCQRHPYSPATREGFHRACLTKKKLSKVSALLYISHLLYYTISSLKIHVLDKKKNSQRSMPCCIYYIKSLCILYQKNVFLIF
jgi:hypothetical protein